MTYPEVIRMRRKAAEMLELALEAARKGYEAEAEKIIDDYTYGHITYRQALARLKKLVNNTR